MTEIKRGITITTKITNKELDILKAKAKKFDDIDSIVNKAYEYDDNGDVVDNGEDLCTIGEAVCSYLGYL